MLRIYVLDKQYYRRGRWTEVPNGPFPITLAQLDEARQLYKAEWDACMDPLSGIKQSPQTAARDILKQVAPYLSDFDRGMIGFAVSNDKIRTEPA